MRHLKFHQRLSRWAIVAASICGLAPLQGNNGGHTTGIFHGCPPEGKGGDPELNARKNRDVPPDTYEVLSLQKVLETRPPTATSMGKRHREKWSEEAKREIEDWEAKGARVEGRLIAVRQQGPEACNCGSSTDVDFHIWIATRASSDSKPTESMVVEISPRELGGHPGWTKAHLIALSKEGARVRVSGWITWDGEHGSEVGKSRGTLWEIHPIHKIERFTQGDWVDIDQDGDASTPAEGNPN